MDKLISVIVPIYNVEKFLKQCLDSIINQTYKFLEIILIDDGSSDNSGKICDDYALIDKRVIVIHQLNGGQSLARNKGLDICRGDYVAFVDSDDWLELNAFERLLNFSETKDLDAVFMGVNVVENGVVTKHKKDFFPNRSIVDANIVVKLLLKDEIGGQPWLKICRRHLWKNVRFPEGRIYEDLAISFYPFLNAKRKVGFLCDYLYNYRMNLNGTSLSYQPNKNYHIYLGFYEHYKYAIVHFKDEADVCLTKTAMFALGTIHSSLKDSWTDISHDLDDVYNFLSIHKKEIQNKCKFSFKYTMCFRMYYFSKNTYLTIVKYVFRLSKLFNR